MESFDLLRLLIVLNVAKISQCCYSCDKTHPQLEYCTSSYVIKALVKSIEYSVDEAKPYFDDSSLSPSSHYHSAPEESWIDYNVYIDTVYKGSHLVSPKTYENLTSRSYSICDTDFLEVNHTYLLMGYRPTGFYNLRFGHCGFYPRFDMLTRTQLQGIRRNYRKRCEQCTVCSTERCRRNFDRDSYCTLGSSPVGSGDEEGLCEIDHANCGRRKGQCTWLGRMEYKTCKRREQRKLT